MVSFIRPEFRELNIEKVENSYTKMKVISIKYIPFFTCAMIISFNILSNK